MQVVLYRGWPLALAQPDRVHLHPALDALAERDVSEPLVRFACTLALHAFEIHNSLIQGPFDQARAERYVRDLLMPADDFAPLAGSADADLAALFGCRSSRWRRGASSVACDRPAPSRHDERLACTRAREIDRTTTKEDRMRVYSKHELLHDVWGYKAKGSTRTLDANACRLRRNVGRARAVGHVLNCGVCATGCERSWSTRTRSGEPRPTQRAP